MVLSSSADLVAPRTVSDVGRTRPDTMSVASYPSASILHPLAWPAVYYE